MTASLNVPGSNPATTFDLDVTQIVQEFVLMMYVLQVPSYVYTRY